MISSRPVKVTVTGPRTLPAGLDWQDRLIAAAGGTLDDWRTAICGQFCAMPAARARAHYLPAGLPVESGFLRTMMLNDTLTVPQDFTRIDGEDVWHICDSERSIPALIRHLTRIVIGSAINPAVFQHLRIQIGCPNCPGPLLIPAGWPA